MSWFLSCGVVRAGPKPFQSLASQNLGKYMPQAPTPRASPLIKHPSTEPPSAITIASLSEERPLLRYNVSSFSCQTSTDPTRRPALFHRLSESTPHQVRTNEHTSQCTRHGRATSIILCTSSLVSSPCASSRECTISSPLELRSPDVARAHADWEGETGHTPHAARQRPDFNSTRRCRDARSCACCSLTLCSRRCPLSPPLPHPLHCTGWCRLKL